MFLKNFPQGNFLAISLQRVLELVVCTCQTLHSVAVVCMRAYSYACYTSADTVIIAPLLLMMLAPVERCIGVYTCVHISMLLCVLTAA
jgi:hypothetical protein